MVHGLETGSADLDGDGQVAVGELYDYVYEQVRQNSPDQTPTMSADGMRGKHGRCTNSASASDA